MQFRSLCILLGFFFLLVGCHRRPAVLHRIQEGETLYRISRTYDISLEQLLRANVIDDPRSIAVGRKILIPGAGYRRELPKAVFHEDPSAAPEVESLDISTVEPNGVDRRPNGGNSVISDPQKKAVEKVAAKPKASTPKQKIIQFSWPADGEVISTFGVHDQKMYNGIGIRLGTDMRIRASADGKVVYVGDEIAGYGKLVILRHGQRTFTVYAYLGDILVTKDEWIKTGHVLARNHATSGPFLHFEIRKGKQALDPLRLLPKRS